jgi:Protein of unknown function (DUF2970)
METVKTVLAGLIGVRRREDHDKAALNPVHVILTAIVLVVAFILILVTIVRVVTG